MFSGILKEGFERSGVPAGDAAIGKMHDFYLLLEQANDSMNLTAVKGEQANARRNFLDSCNRPAYDVFLHAENVIDVGSGAGFPGLPLAILLPHVRFTLLEARQKRADFLSMCRERLGLTNVEVVCARAEDAARTPLRESFDAATARAVAETNILCEYLLPFIKTGGTACLYKGASAHEEALHAQNAAHLLGGGDFIIKNYTIFDDKDQFHMILTPKVSPTPTQYPRKSGKPTKHPLI